MDGWVDGWVGVKAVLRIAYSNQKYQNENERGKNREWKKKERMIILLGQRISKY
jgi:hypothetical protein